MATITFKGGKDGEKYLKKLSTLEKNLRKKIIGKAIYQAADIVTDAIKDNLDHIPAGYGRGSPSHPLPGPPKSTLEALRQDLGITPMLQDGDGFWNVKIGWDGYTNRKTKRWPKGQPLPMLARATESGTSWMLKNPFVRPAVDKNRRKAAKIMADITQAEIEKIMK